MAKFMRLPPRWALIILRIPDIMLRLKRGGKISEKGEFYEAKAQVADD